MPNGDRELPERDGGVLYSRAAVDPASLSEEDRSVEVVASTEDIDRHGTIVKANWDLTGYRENPVVLFAHNSRELPIGTASDVRVTDGKLRAKISFSTKELSARAEEVWQNVKAKTLKGVSVGFWPRTVKFERHEDKEVLVLDDNELWEISMCPVPSNPAALAEMRARAVPVEPAQPPEPTPAPAPPVATKATPETPEKTNMTDPKPVQATPAIAAALGLPAGASEADMIARASNLRELEVQSLAITGAQLSNEAIGAMRGIKASADEAVKLREENTTLKAERDQQAFDALLLRGQSEPVKLTPAMAKLYQERFASAQGEGRGAAVVSDLKGFLDIAPRVIPERKIQPTRATGSQATGLTHNGKTYGELKFAERARLSREEPDLYRAMKSDFEAAQAS